MSGESQPQDTRPSDDSHATLAQVLMDHLACLQDDELPENAALHQQVAATLGLLIELLQRIEQTLLSQLEVLGKSNPTIKSMSDSLQHQNMLSIERAVRQTLGSGSAALTPLSQYRALLLRWWSAVLAGVQTTILEVPQELDAALNHSTWEVEKKRWSAEAEAYWNHYRYVIRPELPLRLGDRIKNIQASKTLEAYSIIGSRDRSG